MEYSSRWSEGKLSRSSRRRRKVDASDESDWDGRRGRRRVDIEFIALKELILSMLFVTLGLLGVVIKAFKERIIISATTSIRSMVAGIMGRRRCLVVIMVIIILVCLV